MLSMKRHIDQAAARKEGEKIYRLFKSGKKLTMTGGPEIPRRVMFQRDETGHDVPTASFFEALMIPPVPKRHPKPPKQHRPPREKSEAKLQSEDVVPWLVEHGVVLAITDAGILHKHGIEQRCGIPKGWPDITCCVRGGIFVGIELKSLRGTQSKEQRDHQRAIEALGGYYILARSLRDVQNYFAEHLL